LSMPHLQTTCRDWDRCLSARNGGHLSLQACLRLKNIGGAKVRLQLEAPGSRSATWRKSRRTLRLKCDGGTIECLTPSSRTLGLNPGKPSRRSPDALAVHARGDAAHDAHCPKPAHWKKHHRASKANPLTQRRRGADPQADHERNIEERGCQSRMSSESALRTERLTSHKVVKPRRAAPSLRR
jgi:hypothetical protein